MTQRPVDAGTEHLLRDLAPQVLGIVMRRFRDFSAAEDAVQEAMLAASAQWAREGVPSSPRAWLVQVASRRLIDQQRSDIARRRRESEAVAQVDLHAPAADAEGAADTAEGHDDDALILLFMCCHASLTPASAIALTLRAVGGLTTAEIANAYLIPEATMAQRISRAKRSVKTSGVPFRSPTDAERRERLPAVLHVLYLIFSEGYTSSSGAQLQRADLAREAIRVTRIIGATLPNETEVAGLLALMLLTDARRAARTGPNGELITLTDQDRALWDQSEIAEGTAVLTSALAQGTVGPYQLQAAIAALHDEASRPDDTDWPQILALYDLLKRMSSNPMVALNHAIAAAMVHGPATGLDLLRPLDSDARIAGHHRLAATRAHLLEMSGDVTAAVAQYRIAAGCTTSIPERNYLLMQAARLRE